MHIINIGTFPPKQCGIASFSSDLCASLKALGHKIDVIAVSDSSYSYQYPSEVVLEIRQHQKPDYTAAADWINQASPDAVLIQHEYGIYGGDCGDFILNLTEKLQVPYFVLLHTILQSPSYQQHVILYQLAQNARQVIIMNQQNHNLLVSRYNIPAEKIVFIPHGVPVFDKEPASVLKQRYQLSGKKIVSTFGLIGPGKGLELGLDSFHKAAVSRPEICYLILGQTHPMLKKSEGESYRERLQEKIHDLHLEQQVFFVNHFLSLKELGDYMYMTDVYLSPYPNLEQSVSGTMAFAIGCGRAIVSTPYAYAAENLSHGCGLTSRHVSAEELGSLLAMVLDDDKVKTELQKNAAERGAGWSWPEVGKQYAGCFQKNIVSSHYSHSQGAAAYDA